MNVCVSLPDDTKSELEADVKIDFSFSGNSGLVMLSKVLALWVRLYWVLTVRNLKAHIQENVGKILGL